MAFNWVHSLTNPDDLLEGQIMFMNNPEYVTYRQNGVLYHDVRLLVGTDIQNLERKIDELHEQVTRLENQIDEINYG